MNSFFIIIFIIIGLILLWSVKSYNQLIRMIEAINNNKRQIDIQLDRRFKVFESLIAAVKKYLDYEKSTLKDVVALRNQAQRAKSEGDEAKRISLENEISRIASHLDVVFEQYPDLKANQNVLQLQEEIVNTENKLAFAKQAFNDSIERYNARKKAFFESMLINIFSNLNQNFFYWELTEEEVKKQEAYTVKF